MMYIVVCVVTGVQHTLQLTEQMKERLEEEIVQLNREKAELFETLGAVSVHLHHLYQWSISLHLRTYFHNFSRVCVCSRTDRRELWLRS
jgi:hypothetical protein